jgi:hypothetical protein
VQRNVHVHFVARALSSHWPDIERLDESDIARHAQRFRGGVNNWIVQTYLRLRDPLRRADILPTIGDALVPGCINIAHRDSLNRLLTPYHRSYVVGIRADRPPLHSCNWEIAQNDLAPKRSRMRYLPLWPQPGLITRDAARGSRIERIAYFGRTSSAPAWFYDGAFAGELSRLGVTFEIRDEQWFDYGQVDLVLAHRIEAATMLRHKPASKLVNAWLAGTPALLADEPAFARLKRSELDYIAIETSRDVVAAVRELRKLPALYLAMVENGLGRGAAYSVHATKERWLRFILDDVVADAIKWRTARRPSYFSWLPQLGAMSLQKIATKRFKFRVYREWHQQSYLRARGSS